MIDAHVHVVSDDKTAYPLWRHEHAGHEWVDAAPDVASFESELDVAGVAKAVLVQPHGAYGTDNRYICDAAANSDRYASVAIVDMAGADRLARVEHWVGCGIAGLRLFSIPTPRRSWLDDPVTDDVWALAGQAGLVMGVCILPVELPALGRAARRHPGHPIVLDHCGFADLTDRDSASFAALVEASAVGNVSLKVTTHVVDAWVASGRPLDELLPLCVDLVGKARVVWGSDYAQTHDRTYPALVDLGRRALDPLDTDTRTAVAHANADALWFGGSR